MADQPPMKPCVFCREDIREDAIKCRYCGSSLLPLQPTGSAAGDAATPGKVTYVVDEGLVRFGKFALALLAIFITVGLVLYGVDVKEMAKHADESRRQAEQSAKESGAVTAGIQKLQGDANRTASQIQSSRDAVSKDLTASQTLLGEAQQKIKDLQDQVAQVQAKMKVMTAKAEAAQAGASRAASKSEEFLAQISKNKDRSDALVSNIAFATSGSAGAQTPAAGSASGKPGPHTVPELIKYYGFPDQFRGSGQKIALIELADGYLESDIDAYFKQVGVPKPKITKVFLGGVKENASSSGQNLQVELDIEIVGAAAPDAEIVIYFAPNTNAGFVQAVQAAVARHTDILSISWGSPEGSWTSGAVQVINSELQRGAAAGMTVVVAAGSGSIDGSPNGARQVDFPASSPWVLAVGGTQILAAGSKITSEVGWSENLRGAPGGGYVSTRFPKPSWQAAINAPAPPGGNGGRATPDVSANASPESGYIMHLDGHETAIGGTSASAPLWAALIARINEGLGKDVGFINPVLYTKLGPEGALRPVGEGGRVGWSATTGWGSPDGGRLLQALRSSQQPSR